MQTGWKIVLEREMDEVSCGEASVKPESSVKMILHLINSGVGCVNFSNNNCPPLAKVHYMRNMLRHADLVGTPDIPRASARGQELLVCHNTLVCM